MAQRIALGLDYTWRNTRSAASEPALPAWVHEMVPDKPCGGFSTGLSTGACTVRAEVSDWMSLVAGGGGGTCQN